PRSGKKPSVPCAGVGPACARGGCLRGPLVRPSGWFWTRCRSGRCLTSVRNRGGRGGARGGRGVREIWVGDFREGASYSEPGCGSEAFLLLRGFMRYPAG